MRVGACGQGSGRGNRGDGGAGRIKGIRGRDWERLITARRRLFFNEQLDPISRGQQQPSKSPQPPPSPLPLSVLAAASAGAALSPPSISVHNPADFTQHRRPLGQPVAGSPPTPALIWQPQIMLRLQRRAAAHMRSREAVFSPRHSERVCCYHRATIQCLIIRKIMLMLF